MVRENKTRVCGLNDMKCYKKVEKKFGEENYCECLLECGEIVYKTEEQQNNFAR
jgi:hypothetical protein